MHPGKRLSIKSATAAGIATSVLWDLQASLSIQGQPRRSCIANTSVIPPIALPGQASCLSLVPWRALRSIITPVAMQMVASIALGAGGKGLFRGSRARQRGATRQRANSRERIRRPARRAVGTDRGRVAATTIAAID